MTRAIVLIALGLSACASGSDAPAETVQVGPLEFAPPPGWTARELAPDTREWVPGHNVRRESLTVIIGPRFLGGADRAFRQTREALGLLPDGRVVSAASVSTESGLAGMQFEVTFHPATAPGQTYRRSHVVLFANDQTFHVLYTVRGADSTATTLAHVLDTIEIGG